MGWNYTHETGTIAGFLLGQGKSENLLEGQSGKVTEIRDY